MKTSCINHNTYPLEIAKTKRYLYHIAYKSARNAIKEKGLLALRKCEGDKRGLLFAHNNEVVTMCWYNLHLDVYSWEIDPTIWEMQDTIHERDWMRMMVNKNYDIWRIDNTIAQKHWYIDHIGWEDQLSIEENKHLYVKCYGNVPTNAITLCCLDTDIKEKNYCANEVMYKTYYNPIISRKEFISKHNCAPEQEYIDTVENCKIEIAETEVFYPKGFAVI